MYVNAILDASLYHNDQGPANTYKNLAGLTLLDFDNDHTTFRPDSIVLRDANDALVVFGATTNIPQWIVHVGGSVIPVIDPITGDSMLTSAWSGTLQTLPVMSDILLPIIHGGGTVRCAGHSYGGACAFTLATWLIYLAKAQTECMTFGEPKVFGGLRSLKEPGVHFRVVAATYGGTVGEERFIDPVSQLPPGCLQYVGLGYAVKIAAFIWTLKFLPRGYRVIIDKYGLYMDQESLVWAIPYFSEFLLQQQLLDGTLLHLMDTSYLPLVHAAWLKSGLYPELHAFDAYYSSYTSTPYVPPTVYGPPLSFDTINTSLELQATPITDANAGTWTNVSSVGTLIPASGNNRSTTMTLMKGSLLCGIMNQGFSESFHSADPSDTYLNMQLKFAAVMNARMTLSNGINDNPPLARNNNMSIVALRFSDELLNRDVLALPVVTPFGWNGSAGNMDGQQAIKITWRNTVGQQIAVTYLHGVPVSATALTTLGNEERNSAMSGTWKTNLQNYCNVLAAKQLGFNTINNNPSNAFGAITAVSYNLVTGYYTFTVTNAVPNGKFRVALRSFKSLRFLNGRQPANYVAANQFIVYKRAPQATWDNSGTAVPLSGYNSFVPFSNYIVVVPATATPSLLCTRKLGRPFFLQAGRVTRRAA
jgi:hypothetical protein